MHFKYWKFVLFSATFLSQASGATLDDCLKWGQERNPTLSRLRLEKALDEPGSRAAWGQFLPLINVGYGFDQSSYYNQTYLNPDGTVTRLPVTLVNGKVIPVQSGRRRDSQWFLRVEEILFDGGRNYYNLRNSALVNANRSQQISAQSLILRADITRAYASLVSSVQMLNLAGEVIIQRQRQLELAEVRFNTGSVTKRDVMQAEVDWGRARTDSMNAALELRRAQNALNLAIGLPIDTTFTIAPLPPLFQPGWAADSLAEAAVTQRAEIGAATLNSNLKYNNWKAAKGDWLPQLSADLTHSRSEQSGANVPFTLNPRNRYTSLGMTLSWTLFDRFTRSLRTQEAKIAQDQTNIQRSELEREVRMETLTAADRLEVLYQQAVVAAQNSRWAKETLDFEQERYRLGSASVIELGAAQLSYIQARSEQIRLESEFAAALGDLERAVGNPLRSGS
ncbi:MAG: TolC family protein [Calditrichota bacterium]